VISSWKTGDVDAQLSLAPSAAGAPIPPGTTVILDETAQFLGHTFIAGGSPWRLLRLPGGSKSVLDRWSSGGTVRAGEERLARTLIQQGLLRPLYRVTLDVEQIDVVIPVRDDVPGLRRLLGSLRGLHVTVVDDGSVNPGLVNECTQLFGATLVTLGQNRGPGAARNAGADATSRPLICFIDADVALDDAHDVLARLYAQFPDPLLGACAPRIRGGAGDSIKDRFEQRFSPLDQGERSGLVMPEGSISYVPSACLMVRRDAFDDGFDEELRTGEDVDLVWRLHDRGWLVRYVADVVVAHRARATWRRWFAQRVGYGSSAGELAIRHGSRLAPVRADAWTLVAWTSVLAGRPLIAQRIYRVTRERLGERLVTQGDDDVSDAIVRKAMIATGGPLARALVRTFGIAILAAALHPRLRRRALLIFAVGTAWRWRHQRVHLADIPLAVADDGAYGVGVIKGAWRTRSLTPLTPQIKKSSLSVRDVLGIPSRTTR